MSEYQCCVKTHLCRSHSTGMPGTEWAFLSWAAWQSVSVLFSLCRSCFFLRIYCLSFFLCDCADCCPLLFSHAAVCDMVSQVSMLYMLLSLCVGWTLSKNRKPQSRPLQWDSSPASKALAMGGVATQVRASSAYPWPLIPYPELLSPDPQTNVHLTGYSSPYYSH